MGRRKKRTYFLPVDTSSVRAKLDEILAEDPNGERCNDPYAELAERLGIRLGEDIKTTTPLKNLLENKRVSPESADLFRERLGIEFIEDRVPIKGRPKRPCALEHMKASGARIGVVPNHMYYSTDRARMMWLAKKLREDLMKLGVSNFDVQIISNRHVPLHLEEGMHFILGSAETLDNKPFIETVSIIHDQRLGILAKKHWDKPGRVAVLVGTAEEAILRSLDLRNIVAMDFGEAQTAHAQLFDMVKHGVCIGAVSSLLAVNNYLAAHSQQAGKLLEIFNQARMNKTVGETTSILLEPEPVLADDGSELIQVAVEHTDAWLRANCGYTGNESVLELSFPLGIAIPKRSRQLNYEKLITLLKRPIQTPWKEPKRDAEYLEEIFKLNLARLKGRRYRSGDGHEADEDS